MKNTAVTFQEMKAKGEKISMLTCYDYSTAKLMEAAGINAVLVGDSLGNTMLGYPDTLSVTLEDTITFGGAVARGCHDTLVILDMPFMTYQASIEQALMNAGRLMKEGRGGAVKLEGGATVCPQIKAMTEAGIPVMAHLGLTPQSINTLGGNKVQGKTEQAAKQLLEDAYAVQDAGAFSVVLECIPAPLAEFITRALRIPTIGIGGGNGCDGQILVYQDMLGMFSDFVPKFVKQFGNIGEMMTKAFQDYDAEVKAATFPDEEHSFKMKDPEVLHHLVKELRPEEAVGGEVDPEYLAKLY
ncbi:MAG: 3-methyl-2-oxobutanoate hydroxymethyltransferase [Clostridia bacterium]|nr:3-methyl-2-oxobutanoate hydroxymethyltransferase [Clostridia bacterium]